MNEPRSARYQRLRRQAHLGRIAAAAVVLAAAALSPAARWVAASSASAAAFLPALLAPVASAVLSALTFALAAEAAAAAVATWIGAAMEREFDGRLGTAAGLARSHAAMAALRVAVVLAASGVFAAVVRLAGAWWWLVCGSIAAAAWGGALRLAPALLIRRAATRPIGRRSLMSALREIARRSNVPVSDVLEWRAAPPGAGALVAGFGRTCRVLVASEVLRDWSDDEIAVVVAHELAHQVHGDLWRELALNAAVLSAALWTAGQTVTLWSAALGITGAADPAALPALVLVAGAVWLVGTPLRLSQSRRHERRADAFALALTREADAFSAAVRRLSARHLSDERPSLLARGFFYRHPPVADRLAMAQRFREWGNGAMGQ